jgi:hypothetical protein
VLALAAFLFGVRRTAAAQTTVQQVIDSAAASGLPPGPLISKAQEGAAKHADAQRIVAAVRSLSIDLATARSALGADADEATLMAGVGALRAGATTAYLGEIRAIRGAPSVAWPLIVLADLVSRGVPVDTAAGVVLVLVRAGAADNAYLGLQEHLQEQLRRGSQAGGAAPQSAPPRVLPPGTGSPPRPARPDVAPHP